MLRAFLGSLLLAVAGVPASAEPEYSPFVTTQLADGVHLMSTPPDYLAFTVSNILIVEQSDGVVIVDSGATRRDGDQIVRYVRALTSKPAKALIYTHWHNDHLHGASQIRDAWPKIRVIATEGTRAGIDGPARSEGLDYKPNPAAVATISKQLEESVSQAEAAAAAATTPWMRKRYTRMAAENRAGIAAFVGTHFVAPTEILRDEIVIDDPDLPVHVRFLGRANTDGDAIVWLPNQRLVATGDVVVSPVPFGFGSYPGDWIRTLEAIKALEFDTLVPGHGLPQSGTSYVDRLIASLTDVRSQVGRLAGQGMTLAQVREKVDFSGQTAMLGAAPRRKPAIEAMWLRPMIENAYKEAKGIPIVQGEGELP